MAMAGLYRRLLPSPPAIDFASSDGKVSDSYSSFSSSISKKKLKFFFIKIYDLDEFVY